jgi:hypothetical protein
MRYTVKKTFDVAKQASVDLIVQVKSNQPTLHQNITELSAATAPLSSQHSRDKGRNRDESRTVRVFDPSGKLDDRDWQVHGRSTPRPSSASNALSTPATLETGC